MAKDLSKLHVRIATTVRKAMALQHFTARMEVMIAAFPMFSE